MKKESFVLYTMQHQAIEPLTLEQKGQLFDALFLYCEGGDPEGLDPIVEVTFRFFKMQIDLDSEKYEKRRIQNAENGKKGGRPKKPNGFSENRKNRTVILETHNDNDNDNDNEDDNDTPVSKETVSDNEHPNGCMSIGDAELTTIRSAKEKVRCFFNEKMKHKAIKCIKSIDNNRAVMLNARLKEYGIDAVFDMIVKASESDFLNGGNNRDFVATFDWLVRPNNFPKVLEGNYDNRPRATEQVTVLNTEWQS